MKGIAVQRSARITILRSAIRHAQHVAATLAVTAVLGLSGSNAVAGNFDPSQLASCLKVCSQQRQKEENYCKSTHKNDNQKISICVQNARNDEDKCDKSCEKKYGR
jgi:hypothetical protein